MPTKLGRSLEQARVPRSDADRGLVEQLVDAPPAERRQRHRPKPASWLAGAVGVAATVGLIVLLAGEPSPQSEPQPDGPGGLVGDPAAPLPDDGTVVGGGETPEGEPYELVLAETPVGGGRGAVSCLFVSNPAQDQVSKDCLNPAAFEDLEQPGGLRALGNSGPSALLVTAAANPEVKAGSVEASAAQVSMNMDAFELEVPGPDRRGQGPAERRRITYLVGFLPRPPGDPSIGPGDEPDVRLKPLSRPAPRPAGVRVVGFDEAGNVVATAPVRAVPPQQAALSLPGAEGPNQVALETCNGAALDGVSGGPKPELRPLGESPRGQLRDYGYYCSEGGLKKSERGAKP